MIGAKTEAANCATYELEVEIAAPPARVWEALLDETNAWWLPDFHMVGAGSVLTFDARAGGHLIERTEDGGSLLWFSVHMILPEARTIYLVGHVAPDWGGPAAAHLKLAVEAAGDGAVLRVTDAQFGHVDEKNLGSMKEGWTQLFTDGLKRFVEDGVRHDG